MGKYLFKANALERKWYDLHRRKCCLSCAAAKILFEKPHHDFFSVLASPEITINSRYRRIFSSVFSLFIDKYTSATNMFNKPH